MASPDPDQRLPVTLVTGFLGSGKTTLVNAVLHNAAFANAMVIVNEFGEVGLDHLLMEGGDDKVVLLDSGCLCCAVSGSLRDTLIDLFMRRATGALPAFDRVIVETSGLANPVPLISSLVADSAVSRHFRLSLVLTLVDATNAQPTLARHDEALKQVAVADRLLLSKGELAGAAAVEQLRVRLADMNAGADIRCWRRDSDPSPFFADAPATQLRSPLAAPGFAPGPFHGGATHGPAFAAIRAHILHVPGVIDWSAYAAWTAHMQRSFGWRLLRCKGLLRIGADDAVWVIQGVQGHFTAPVRLGAAAAAGLVDSQRDFLVCVGEGISSKDLQSTLAFFGAHDFPGAPASPVLEHQ
jgi:G3E family GTPase